MIKLLSSEKGFTLIEMMITAVITVLMLVGYMAANSSIYQASEAAFQRTVALQDAHQVLERIRNAAASGTFPSGVVAAYPNGSTVSEFNSLNLTSESVSVSYANSTANPLDVTVSVSWLENGRRNVSTQLRSYVTQRA